MAFTPKVATIGARGTLRPERVHRTVTLADLVEAVASESCSAAEAVTVVAHMLRSRRVIWGEAPVHGRGAGIA